MNKHLYILSLLMIISGCYVGEELPPDQDVWGYDLPRNHSMSEPALHELDAQLNARTFQQINGLVIIKNDHLIFENYYNDSFKRSSIQSIGRATNIVTMFTLGLMLEDGYLPGLDVLIKDYLPERYQDLFEGDQPKSAITIRHLLKHQSGLPWDEYITPPENQNSSYQAMRLKSDWVRFMLNRPMEASPGLRTVLNSSTSLILSSMFQRALGEIPLEEYIKERLFDPMKITNYEWEYDPSGNLNLARGLSISSLGFTKLGYLTLLEGRWIDKQRIINREWVLECTELQTLLDERLGFGYGWWRFPPDIEAQSLGGRSTFFVTGSLGQNLYVIPEENMVVAIMGENFLNPIVYNSSLNLFVRVLATLNPSAGSDI